MANKVTYRLKQYLWCNCGNLTTKGQGHRKLNIPRYHLSSRQQSIKTGVNFHYTLNRLKHEHHRYSGVPNSKFAIAFPFKLISFNTRATARCESIYEFPSSSVLAFIEFPPAGLCLNKNVKYLHSDSVPLTHGNRTINSNLQSYTEFNNKHFSAKTWEY